MWLNDITLNIDSIALCEVLVLNQTEQGLRHLLGCACWLSLPQGLPQAWEICSIWSKPQGVWGLSVICFSFFLLLLGVKIFITETFFPPLTLLYLLSLFHPNQYLFSQQLHIHRDTHTLIYTLIHPRIYDLIQARLTSHPILNGTKNNSTVPF